MNEIEHLSPKFPRLDEFLRNMTSPESMKRIPPILVKIAGIATVILGVRLFEQPQPRQEIPQPPPDAIFITVEPSVMDIRKGDTVTVKIPPYDELRAAGREFLSVRVLEVYKNDKEEITGILYEDSGGTQNTVSANEIVSLVPDPLHLSSN